MTFINAFIAMFFVMQTLRCRTMRTLNYNYCNAYSKSRYWEILSANFNKREVRSYSSSFGITNRPTVSGKLMPTDFLPVRFVSNESTMLHNVYCDTRPVLYIQDLFQNIHDISGLPWWSTIVITVIGLRFFVTLPLAVYQHYVLAKYENLGPEIKALSEELMIETKVAAKKYNLDEKRARLIFTLNLKNHTNKLIIRDNCHPFKASLLIYFQIPLWFSQSLSLRNLVYMMPVKNVAAQLTFVQLSVGGTLWFSNLTFPDTTWILPILMGIVNFSIIEFNMLRLNRPPSRLHRWLTNGFRVLTVLLVPVAASVPSCLTLSWFTSSVFGLVQNIVLHQPKVRRFFWIPKTPSESETPLKDVLKKIKQKFKSA